MPSRPEEEVCVRFQPVSQVQSREVRWFWPGRLPLGKLAIIESDPDMGKSLVTLDLCARLSTGRPFPDGSPRPEARYAVLLETRADSKATAVLVVYFLGSLSTPKPLHQ